MTVPVQTPISSSTANGLTSVFPYAFKIARAGDLFVTVNGTVRSLNTHYTVDGLGNDDGGNITFVTGFKPVPGDVVVRRRLMAYQRTIAFQNLGDLLASTLNTDQDDPVMMIQQLAANSLGLVQNADGSFSWDAQGNRIIRVGNAVDPGDAVNFSQLVDAVDPNGPGIGVTPIKWDFVGDGVTTDFPIVGATIFNPLYFDAAKAGAVIEPSVDYTIIPGDGVTAPLFRFTTAPANTVPAFAVLRGYAKAGTNGDPITTTASIIIATDGTDLPVDGSGNPIIDNTFQNALIICTAATDITFAIKKSTGAANDWQAGQYFSIMAFGDGQVTLISQDSAGTLYPSPGFLAKTRGKDSIMSGSCLFPDSDQWAISGDLLRTTATPDRQAFTLPCSDEATTDITAATNVYRFRMPFGILLSDVRATLNVAQPSGTVLTVDVKLNGTSIFSTKLTIDNAETTSVTASSPFILVAPNNTILGDSDVVSVDVTQVGATGARGLKVQVIGGRL